MALIIQNFRLNALANQYASALYTHICATSTGVASRLMPEGRQYR
jgi:hypothetical protein